MNVGIWIWVQDVKKVAQSNIPGGVLSSTDLAMLGQYRWASPVCISGWLLGWYTCSLQDGTPSLGSISSLEKTYSLDNKNHQTGVAYQIWWDLPTEINSYPSSPRCSCMQEDVDQYLVEHFSSITWTCLAQPRFRDLYGLPARQEKWLDWDKCIETGFIRQGCPLFAASHPFIRNSELGILSFLNTLPELPRLTKFILLARRVIQLHKPFDIMQFCKAEC